MIKDSQMWCSFHITVRLSSAFISRCSKNNCIFFIFKCNNNSSIECNSIAIQNILSLMEVNHSPYILSLLVIQLTISLPTLLRLYCTLITCINKFILCTTCFSQTWTRPVNTSSARVSIYDLRLLSYNL